MACISGSCIGIRSMVQYMVCTWNVNSHVGLVKLKLYD